MPRFHVQRSIEINAPAERVFEVTSDYGQWTRWSPWLCTEPDANVTVSDNANSVGSVYAWSGDLVGAGEIEHKQLVSPKSIDDEIRFTKPFKSTSQVKFEIEPTDSGSQITWHMDGSLPWFMFWMTSKMDTFIGMDYDRGLRMLKELIETGNVSSKTDIVGKQTMGPFQVVGVRRTCAVKDVGQSMGEAFPEARRLADEHGLPAGGESVSVYHRFDMKNQTFEYTSGFMTTEPIQSAPAGLETWGLPAIECLRVDHIGCYSHLGNAWSAANTFARYKKLKQSKIGAFELYKNSPEHVAPAELLTEVYLPLR